MMKKWITGVVLAGLAAIVSEVVVVNPVSASFTENAVVVRAKAKTYCVRLTAEYDGKVVDTKDITFSATDENDLAFRNAVGDAERLLGQSLDDRKIKWSRINHVVLSAR